MRSARRSWRKRSSGTSYPITTEKDRVRLNRAGDAAERLAAAAETFPIHVRFEEPRRLSVLIEDAVGVACRRLPALPAGHFASRRDSSRLSEAATSA